MSHYLGSIGEFKESEEDFETYLSRVKLYFEANDIDDKKQKSVFLTLLGPKVFGLAKTLCAPQTLDKCSLDDITKALTSHYTPKVIVIYERYKFYSRNQEQGETIKDFVAKLRELASTCKFKDSLDDMLRDRFVMGLCSAATQQNLLAESELTFDKAVKVATAREAALRDATAAHKLGITANVNHGRDNVHLVKGNKSNNFKSGEQNSNSSKKSIPPKSACFGCGGKHWKKDCPFKDSECHGCKQVGHIKKMCKNKNMSKSKSTYYIEKNEDAHGNAPVNPNAEYEYTFSVRDSGKIPPINVNVLLNNKKLEMELDTGATRTIIPKNIFYKLWPVASERPVLQDAKINLQTYGGSNLKIHGEIEVMAKLENTGLDIQSRLVIVDNQGPCLLGRDLISSLQLNNFKLSEINKIKIDGKSEWVKKHPQLFASGLGCLKDQKFSIQVDPSVPPKYCKPRPVPYSLREGVEKALDKLVEEGTITPVTHSNWAAPIVPVVKTDGSIRICGDYKLTVNKAALRDTYPIPRLEDLFSSLSGGIIFSKLDMSQAYAQLCLDDQSKKFTVINTSKGLFEYNRLCFGVSSAPGIFQRAMEELLRNVPGVFCYLDDILVSANDRELHDERLNQVFIKMEQAGLRLRWDKCEIGVSEVEYLGFKIDQYGTHPTKKKIEAIIDAPRPTNQTQLRAYLGLFNFYRRFISNASTLLAPLNQLLKNSTNWSWGKDQETAFKASKDALVNSKALCHFDPAKPIVVVADSSAYGIGAVLCHELDGIEYPITFVSRTLTSAEKNYSQLEKEALALVYALKQFHYYLWGQLNFTLVTDHKPLLGLFSESKAIPPLASGRIQRWALILQAYSYTLKHRSGAILGTADALSRLPLPAATDCTPVPGDWTLLVNFLDWSPVCSSDIRKQTDVDPTLSMVHKYLEKGWPSSVSDSNLLPFYRRKDELSLQSGCILWGSRVVVPSKLRDTILKELHSGHTGASRMKELARSYLWWPNLDKQLEDLVGSCQTCLELRPNPPRAELHPWEWPQAPWHRLHVDYAGPVDGRYFLIIVDAHSKWVEIFQTSGTSTSETIKWLRHVFAHFGIPVSLVSDNGPCFTSEEFKRFVGQCGIRHITTAVYKPSTNGLAEKMVQTFKKALKASKESIQTTIDRFLFNYRLTPHCTTGVTPSELMLGRKMRSRLDLLTPLDQVSQRVSQKQEKQKANHAKKPRKVKFDLGSQVMVRNFGVRGPKWLSAKVIEVTGPLSYRCLLERGGVVKRHQDQIQKTTNNDVYQDLEVEDLPFLPMHSGESSMENGESPTIPDPEELPVPGTVQTDHDCSITGGQSGQPSVQVPRKSGRSKKPVDRLNL